MSRSGRPADPWTRAERALLARLDSPARIQAWLDSVPYNPAEGSRSPRSVMAVAAAHCWDGALFAAAALRRLGFPPLLCDLRAVRDDDHVLALFQRRGMWGAVAKSNFVGLRFREPIHRTLRELAVSYFEDYFNEHGEKTLRSYSAAFDLSRFDERCWMTLDGPLDSISDRLDASRHFPLLSDAQVRELLPKDPRSMTAGMVGTNRAGLYKPGGH